MTRRFEGESWEAFKHALDERDRGPTNWPASALMVISYSVLATGRHPELAEEFYSDMLTEARNRYRAGFYADPFSKLPVPRPPVGREQG